jgi:hypothetical protein
VFLKQERFGSRDGLSQFLGFSKKKEDLGEIQGFGFLEQGYDESGLNCLFLMNACFIFIYYLYIFSFIYIFIFIDCSTSISYDNNSFDFHAMSNVAPIKAFYFTIKCCLRVHFRKRFQY